MREIERAIVTVGVNPKRGFQPYHDRFQQSMLRHGRADHVFAWSNNWPPGSPQHVEVHYAFKVYAIEHALKCNYQYILWMDVSCHAIQSMEPIWEEIKETGHFLVIGMDRLGDWSSDHSLEHFNIDRNTAMEMPLMSGTIIGLDMKNPRSKLFFDSLKTYAVAEHFNGTHRSGLMGQIPETEGARMSSDPRCKGHRSDEVYMTVLADRLGMKCNMVGGVFCGGFPPNEKSLVKSGYDLV